MGCSLPATRVKTDRAMSVLPSRRFLIGVTVGSPTDNMSVMERRRESLGVLVITECHKALEFVTLRS